MATFIWSIDDAGTGDDSMVESMRRTCRHFDSCGVKSTWFVVPKPGESPLSAAWREVMEEALSTGHDIQLHGLTHADCYEFGPPNWPFRHHRSSGRSGPRRKASTSLAGP